MSLSPEDARRAFTIWLRTGRRVIVEASGPVETKYNHWHDPRNGQFTYASAGRHDGSWGGGGFTGGGGGDFGGGGASATEPWGPEVWPSQRKKPKQAAVKKPRSTVSGTIPVQSLRPNGRLQSLASPAVSKIAPGANIRRVKRGSYEYQVDEFERTHGLSGTITRGDPTARSRTAQRRAGQPDRRPTDDGGHFIAPRFNGPTDAFNHSRRTRISTAELIASWRANGPWRASAASR